MIVQIGVHGCDDSTVVEMDISPDEFGILRYVAELITLKSAEICQPVMTVTAVNDLAAVKEAA